MQTVQTIITEMQGLKEEISKARIDVATSAGRLSTSLERLKNEFNHDDLESAEKEIEANRKTILTIEQKVIKKFNGLKEEYDF